MLNLNISRVSLIFIIIIFIWSHPMLPPVQSFVQALLPSEGSLEATHLNRLTVAKPGRKKGQLKIAALNAHIAKLLLVIAQETAEAILTHRYKSFDALVKNFGCQITAAEVYALFQTSLKENLLDEAKRVQSYAIEKLTSISQENEIVDSQGINSLREYLEEKIHLKLDVSPQMARLSRLRMLCIINSHREVDGKELPHTDLGLLVQKAPHKQMKEALNPIIGGLQGEESRHAVLYIRQVADRCLPKNSVRRPLVLSALQLERASKSYGKKTPIVSVPLLYNTEAALASITHGIICIKNKLTFCGRPISDAIRHQAFLRMPEETLLSNEEIAHLSPEEPLIVVEGYIQKEGNLAEIVGEGRFLDMVRANCAIIPQYASGASEEDLSKDNVEAAADLLNYASTTYHRARQIMEIDHIYCASVQEER